MKKIGIIGDKDSILGFRAAGISAFITENEKEACDILKSAVNDGYAIMFITEQLAVKISEEIEKYKPSAELAIIVLPGKDGSCGFGLASIKKSVEKAVGADILK